MNARKFFGWLAVLFLISVIVGVASAAPIKPSPRLIYTFENKLLGMKNQRSYWYGMPDSDPAKKAKIAELNDLIRRQEQKILDLQAEVLRNLSVEERRVIEKLPKDEQMGAVDLLDQHYPHERAEALKRFIPNTPTDQCQVWERYH